MSQSRRSFLKYFAALPAGMAIPSLATAINSSEQLGSSANRSGSSDTSDNVTLAISFIGPLASIVEGDDVVIYAPRLENHIAAAGTSANETPLRGDADYELSGLPTPAGEARKIFPPLSCNAQEPYAEARKLRNFTIRLKRPDVMEGIHPVDVFLSDRATVPPDAPMRSLPTGFRFIYNGVSKNLPLRLTGSRDFFYEPSFELDEQTGAHYFELSFQYRSIHAVDTCHRDSTVSFGRLLELFPATNIRSIKFAQEDPRCAMESSSGRLINAELRTRDGVDNHHGARLQRIFTGGGSNCISPGMGSW
jgi:hypothetical protein